MLGLGLLKTPALIMMDEPTNHMDMPSIIRLENALAQFTGALIVVSHDTRFIGVLTDIEWNLVKDNGISRLTVMI